MYRIPKMWIGTRTDLFTMQYETKSISWYVAKSVYFGFNAIVVGLFLVLSFRGIIQGDFLSYLVAAFVFYLAFVYMPFYNIETRYSQPVLSVMLLYIGIRFSYYRKDLFGNIVLGICCFDSNFVFANS